MLALILFCDLFSFFLQVTTRYQVKPSTPILTFFTKKKQNRHTLINIMYWETTTKAAGDVGKDLQCESKTSSKRC